MEYHPPVLITSVDTVDEQHVEMYRAAFGFRFKPPAKRWIGVTAPDSAFLRLSPAFLINAPKIIRCRRVGHEADTGFDRRRHEIEAEKRWQYLDGIDDFVAYPEPDPSMRYAIHVYRKCGETS